LACGIYVSRPVALETGHAWRHIFGQKVQLSSCLVTLSDENGKPGEDEFEAVTGSL